LNVSVGLLEEQSAIEVALMGGVFIDAQGKPCGSGRYRFTSEMTMPVEQRRCELRALVQQNLELAKMAEVVLLPPLLSTLPATITVLTLPG
jgi:hypothetical protein